MTLEKIIELAYQEDIPSGDITTDSLNLGVIRGHARLLAKEDLVFSGRQVFEACLKHHDPFAELNWLFQDGGLILKNQVVCNVKADLARLMKAERVALNFVQHLSGIATLTRCYAQRIQHTSTKILDTRKTLPLYRDLEKTAVLHGGGANHRRDLSAAIMIKDNHIQSVGGISAAVRKARDQGHTFIEVETSTLEQVQEAVHCRVDQIMLDNMTNEQMREALRLIPKDVKTEASGNMHLERVASVAELGVTYISVGAITHSAPAADLSLKITQSHAGQWPKQMPSPIS